MTPGRVTPEPMPPAPAIFAVAVLLSIACSDSSDDARGPVAGTGSPDDAAYSTAGITREDFAGSAACSDCHADQYSRWAESTHGRAGGEPDPETVIAPFDGTPIVFRDGTVLPLVDSAGRYLFVVRQEGHPTRRSPLTA